MSKTALDLLKEYRSIVEGADENSPVYNAIMNRIQTSYPDLIKKFGFDNVAYSVRHKAEVVGHVEEIGTSDVSIWTRQVINELEINHFRWA